MLTTIVNLALPVGDPNRVINIQGYQAESYSETPSQPNFDSIDIGGRSSPIAYYGGGSARTVSFSMMFHRDMVAPQSSAVYGGMPAGIEADGSRYAGLYLGENSQGRSTEELKEQFINDYLKYFNSYITEDKYNQTIAEIARMNIRGNLQGPGTVIGMSTDMTINGTQVRITDMGSYKLVKIPDANGNMETITIPNNAYIMNYDDAFKEQNAKAEADATARFHLFLNKLKALNYPAYHTNGIIPPKVYLKIGGDSNNGLGGIRLKGYCTTSVNYDGIVKYNSLISATVDFTFTEVIDTAWSASEVINGMQRYIKYLDPMIVR